MSRSNKLPNLATAKRVCLGCGNLAHVWDNGWWCGVDFITIHGACKINKSKHNIPAKDMEPKCI